MKAQRPTERERQIYEWKTLGKGLSWSRWCHMTGIKVRSDAPRGSQDARQRVLMHKRPQRSTTHAKA